MLLVTFHGGKPDQDPELNNIHAYDKDGKKLTSTVLEESAKARLNELRGIYFFGKYLYVVNANKEENCVLCYEGSGISYKFVSTLTSRGLCSAILHPFDIALDDAGHCYISSQDTNVVTRLALSEGGKTGTPAPLAPALPANGTFLPGTFVASSNPNLSEPHTTPVAPPAGLLYSATGAKKHSVRGILWARGMLFVADQPASTIKVYDSTGRYAGQSNPVETPVHLTAKDGRIYVSGGDNVTMGELPAVPGPITLAPIKSIKVKNASGIAFGDSGNMYVASRTENTISKFDAAFKPVKYSCDLPDNPEFLLHV